MKTLTFSTYTEREKFLKSYSSKKTKDYLLHWMRTKENVCVFKLVKGHPSVYADIGIIESVEDGVWGYGGDRWAVSVNGEFYPASLCHLAISHSESIQSSIAPDLSTLFEGINYGTLGNLL